jgi:ABC-2 type transport system permease protein
MFLSVPSFILSGYTWPSASLPLPLQLLSQLLPLTHCAVMFRKIYGMGLEISAFPKELSWLAVFIVLHLAAALWAVRRFVGRREVLAQSPASDAPKS